jgi:hypothetical protein
VPNLLVLVVGYLRKVQDNSRVLRHLTHHHPEIQTEFQKLVVSRALMDGAAGGASNG